MRTCRREGRHRLRGTAVLAAVATVLTACGTATDDRHEVVALDHLLPVVEEARGDIAGDDGPGLGEGTPGRVDGIGGVDGADSGAPGADPGGVDPAGTSAPGAAGTGGDTGTPAGSFTLGPGVTEDEILIGFEVATDVAGALATFGYSTGDRPPDERQVVLALVDWINATGGIAGRSVRPIIHETNPLSGTFASQAQAACATFTEDNQVFAVSTTSFGGTQHLPACLASRATPVVANNFYVYTERHHRDWAGYLYQVSRMRAEVGYRITVDGLREQGFFDNARLGIVALDGPDFQYLTDDVVIPRLAEHGIEPVERVNLSNPESAAGAGRLSAEINNAIVRFRAQNVTHVMFVEFQGAVPFLFLPQAESQGYRPRYGLSSMQAPVVVVQNSPEAQLRGMLGVGWTPFGDLRQAQYPPSPERDACRQAAQDGGVNVSYDRFGYYVFPHCDTLLLLRTALANTTALTAGGLRAGVAALGDSQAFPGTLVARFGPERADGAAAWVPFAYDPNCDCARYTSEPRMLP